MEPKNTKPASSTSAEEQADKEPKTTRPEPLMDIQELAQYLNVRTSWLYEKSRLKRTNGFPVLKAGKYLRFDRQKVIDWMAGNDE